MQAPQHRLTIGDITQAEHHVLAARGFIEKTMHGEDREGVGSFEAATKTTGTLCS